MSQEDAEERSLPASDKKIRDVRRKGQVPQSRDLVSGFALFAALIYLLFQWSAVSDHMFRFVDTITTTKGSFDQVLPDVLRAAVTTLIAMSVPLMAVIVGATLLFGVIATRGPVFSFDPVKIRFEHISPAKGLKRIFSARNVIEFCKAFAKVVLLTVLFAVILLNWLQPLFDAPGCGESCSGPMIVQLLTSFGIAAALAFVVIGVIDVPIQTWLFRRDQRMTKTEFKREHKDVEGDPVIRQEFQRLRRGVVAQPKTARRGFGNAVLAFTSGDRIVALRYVSGETPVPVIVARAEGAQAAVLMAEARSLNVPLIEDEYLTEALSNRLSIGDYIPAELFSPVISHLVRFGLV